MNVNPIKMTIIGGFLGSGKTTVLNNIIRNLPEGQRSAILINDFGDVNIDALLIEKGDYSKKEIKGGCICCSLKEQLLRNLLSIVNEEKPDHIYIEATGLAVPWDMKKSIHSNFTKEQLQVENVLICTDVMQFRRFHDYLPAYSRQFEGRPYVLLSKADLYDSDLLIEIKKNLQRHYPGLSGFSESTNGIWCRPETPPREKEKLHKGMMPFLQQINMIDTGKDGIEQITFRGSHKVEMEKLKLLITEQREKIIRLKAVTSNGSSWRSIQFDGILLTDEVISPTESFTSETIIITIFCMKEDISDLNKSFSRLFE